MFRWLAKKLPILSFAQVNIPDCYPDLDFRRLSRVFNSQQFEELSKSKLVCFMPLVRDNSEQDEASFGLSLTQILIRNLMLVRGLSIRGFEDVPLITYESAIRPEDFSYSGTTMIVGYVEVTNRFELNLQLQCGDWQKKLYIVSADLLSLIVDSTQAICDALDVSVEQSAIGHWSHCIPDNIDAMIVHGALRAMSMHTDVDVHAIAKKLYAKHPQFTLALHYLDRSKAETANLLLSGLNRDPYDPQLCYHLFRSIWNNEGPDQRAFQFIRKALEICPSHGKSHMFAAHAAATDIDMLAHSQLGYQLLPDSPNAVRNYLTYMLQAQSITSDAIPLVIENIDRDPFNPQAYWQAIEIFSKLKKYSIAIDTTQQLLRLLQSPVNPHTLKMLGQASLSKHSGQLSMQKQQAELLLDHLQNLENNDSASPSAQVN